MNRAQFAAAVLAVIMNHSPVYAGDLKVVDVRRNIPLRDDDAVYKDFYINGGTKEGLKPNMVVTATRKMNIRDASGQQSIGELNIPVAQLKVVFVQENIAVAREFKPLSRDEFPMLEQVGVMSGDLVETKNSFIDKRKPDSIPSAKNSESAPPVPESKPAAITAQFTLPIAPPVPAPLPLHGENPGEKTPQTPAIPSEPMKTIIGTPGKTLGKDSGHEASNEGNSKTE